MTRLHLAPNLHLDADYVGGGTFAWLAKKGAGKTYGGRVLAEELWKAKVPFVFLDPMGAAWGLRSSADGERQGIPVAIFGGAHGDAPLERGGGALMADLVVDEGLSMVLDLSALGTRAAERQFCHDFLERLYRRNKDLVHLLIDEADLFAPQQPQAGDRPLLGITENIVRRGRNKGIGITLMTQRPAVLNKDVLTQVDGLIAMRIIGLTDREAIDAWVKGHGDVEAAREVKGTLSGLETGECWWWVPELDILTRTRIREARTFDSSPTKKRGEKRREPKTFADVDMAAIQRTMADTIERAKAEDPKALRQTIVALRRELERRPTEQVEVERIVEVPVLDDERVARLEEAVEGLAASAAQIIAAANGLSGDMAKLKARPPAAAAPSAPPRARAPQPRAPAPAADGDVQITPARQRILDALAMLEVIGVRTPSKTQVALFAQASPKSSGYTNNLGALRTAGLIDYLAPGTASLTAGGRAAADAQRAPSTVDELHAFVAQLVGPAKARLIEQLVAVYPESLSKAELADRAGASPTSSGYTNNLGGLRSLGLVDYPTPGRVAAQPVLFLEAA